MQSPVDIISAISYFSCSLANFVWQVSMVVEDEQMEGVPTVSTIGRSLCLWEDLGVRMLFPNQSLLQLLLIG